jgi:7-cyano-7-deazaguanine synthase
MVGGPLGGPSPDRPGQVVLALSGGLDSTVLTHRLRGAGHPLEALSFDYGQRHRRELESAVATAARLGVAHTMVDLRGAPGGVRAGRRARSHRLRRGSGRRPLIGAVG